MGDFVFGTLGLRPAPALVFSCALAAFVLSLTGPRGVCLALSRVRLALSGTQRCLSCAFTQAKAKRIAALICWGGVCQTLLPWKRREFFILSSILTIVPFIV